MKLKSVTFEIGGLFLLHESSHLQQFRNSGYDAKRQRQFALYVYCHLCDS
jgi:hypothetical protein